MTNPQRGEVTIKGPGDKDYNLCLTLGAVAQIETELGLESLADIDQVMGKPSMNHLLVILIALLNGGGHRDISKDDMIDWNVSFKEVLRKIQDAFKASGYTDDSDEEKEDLGN